MNKDNRKEKLKEVNKGFILDAAKELFLKNGVNSTTMDDIASASGFAKGSVYNYFSSKEDIILTIILENIDNIKETILKVDGLDISFYEKIDHLIDFQVKNIYKYLHRMFNKYFKSKEQKMMFMNIHISIQNKVKKDLIPYLKDLILKGQNAGEIRDDLSSDDLAMLLICYTNGVFIYQFNFADSTDIEGNQNLTNDKLPPIIEAHIKFIKNILKK